LIPGVIISSAFFFMAGCGGLENNEPQPIVADIGKAQVWLTRGDKTRLLNREPDLSIRKTASTNWPVIEIDSTVRFQSVEGFGAALTGSSAYLFRQKMSTSQRIAALRDLFDPVNGIGISYLRLTIGASDFSPLDFTYNDLPAGETDFSLEHFSLAQDLDDLVPVLKEIIQVFPGMKLMGSPWSPPAWMKTNNSLKGGKLRQDCYHVYADYFVKYIQEMQNQGLHINAVTPQNEPLHFSAAYPCMEMQPDEQKTFIRDNLGPAFQLAGIEAKIIIYDHNWDNASYALSILDDPEAGAYIAGTAFHAYAGNVSAMSTVHHAHPDKDLYFTEISGGGWATDFSANLMWYMENILIGTMVNWSKVALFWNLALDQDDGPQNNGCGNCRGVITINSNTGAITKNEEYYAIGHFSKFVRPDAERISATYPQTLANMGAVAFINPDGSKVIIVSNYKSDFNTFTITQGGKNFSYSVPPRSVASIIW
jgi:glucosylceramidase